MEKIILYSPNYGGKIEVNKDQLDYFKSKGWHDAPPSKTNVKKVKQNGNN